MTDPEHMTRDELIETVRKLAFRMLNGQGPIEDLIEDMEEFGDDFGYEELFSLVGGQEEALRREDAIYSRGSKETR